jgi:hypothetical protein
MKHEFRMLAQQQLHLIWERVALHLAPADFADLAHFLWAARYQLGACDYCGNSRHFVMLCSETNDCLAWLHGLGLRLPYGEFLELAEMVVQAQHQIANEPPLTATVTPTPGVNTVIYVVEETTHLVYINWRQATFSLAVDHYLAALAFLRVARHHLRKHDEYSDPWHWVQRDDDGFHQLWLRGTGLYLSSADLERFCELCEQGVARLHGEMPQHFPQPRAQYAKMTPNFHFSLN